jgi:PKD repeat protein
MELEWARIYPLVPVNPNTSLSSTAALSWAAPSTPGTYTLELFATNSAGTATDQITVTVT